MPTVAIAHSAEKHRSPEAIHALVEEALDQLGGITAFVKPQQNVLIKADHPGAADLASSTDPLLVAALVELVRSAGAARIQVSDSSDRAGARMELEGAEWIDLSGEDVPKREIPLTAGRRMQSVFLPVPLLEADVIIAAPKAKTDSFDLISGAIESWAGTVIESRRTLQVSDEELIERVADIMTGVQPDLCVTDALICGEGEGPASNFPHWCGCVLVSTDAVATDVAIAQLLGCDWTKLRFAAAVEARGIGRREPVVWLGSNVERVAFHGWRAHQGFGYLPLTVLTGGGVSFSGTVGHVKRALDELVRSGTVERVLRAGRTPTIVIGDVVDPDFERHLTQGPYIVFDDAASISYQNDPRVFFVPGHPVLDRALPELTRVLEMEISRGRRARGMRAAPLIVAIGAALGIAGLFRRYLK